MRNVYLDYSTADLGVNKMFHRRSSTSRKVYRSSSDKVLGGVIGGLAAYFDVSSFWLRVAFLVLQFTFIPVLVIAYGVAFFIMPKGPHLSRQEDHAVASHKKTYPVEPAPVGAMNELTKQYDQIEDKIRRLEDYVTSREFALSRKFEELT